MYASVRKYVGSHDLVDVLVENEGDVKRSLTGIAGFHAYQLVRTHDGAVSISVFDDRRGAEESNRVAAEWIRANASHVSPGAPETSAGEVVLSA